MGRRSLHGASFLLPICRPQVAGPEAAGSHVLLRRSRAAGDGLGLSLFDIEHVLQRQVPDAPPRQCGSVPARDGLGEVRLQAGLYGGAVLGFGLWASGVWRLASGVWRLASGVWRDDDLLV